MNEGSKCPNLEDLAAVADGRAPDHVRERVLRHVADCEDCYETLVGTLEFNAEEEEAKAREVAAGGAVGEDLETPGPVVPSWRRYVPPALAAGLLVALLVPLVSRNMGEELPTLAEYGAALQWQNRPEELVGEIYDTLDRGSTFGPSLDSQSIAFQMGVRLVDLEVARRAGDSIWQDRILTEMKQTLELAAPRLNAQRTLVGRTRERLAEGLSPSDPTNLEAVLAPIEDQFFHFGKWNETGRLAAATRRSTFLVSEEFQKGLNRVQTLTLDPASSAQVERIAELVEGGIQTPEQWISLQRAFSDLIGLSVS